MDVQRMLEIDRILERILDGERVDYASHPPAERALIDRLLRAAGDQTPGLEAPPARHEAFAAGLAASLAATDGIEPGARVGAFRLIDRIGSGGMGVVFLAERVDGGFSQRVALKLLAGTGDDPALFQMFQRERSLLARLEHPNVARLIDGGLTGQHRPWFAMEYVDGEPIGQHADRHRLSVNDRISLFLQACDALDYAHRQLILHRDIKPANLLVAADGTLRLVDFGLGRIFDTAGGGETTIAAGRMTPGYASPEQARGEPVTIASEVYQLGLVLHELLTGELPYEVDRVSAYRIARSIEEAEIRRPSDRWRGVGAADRADAMYREPPERLRRALKGDLDNILLCALAREPDARYAGVAQFAEDLRRHRTRVPVRARAATRRYRLVRFVQRNAAAATVTAVAATALLLAVVLLAVQSGRLQVERDRALASAARSERMVDAMAGMIRLSDSDNRIEQLYSLGDLLDRYVDYVRSELDRDPTIRARLLGILGGALHGIDHWGPARKVIAEAIDELDATLGPDHPDVLQMNMLLAQAMAADGDLAAAVALLDRVAEQYRASSGAVSEPVADTVLLRGFLRAHHGQADSETFAAGVSDLEQALSAYRDLFDPPHPKIASAMHTLGFKLWDQPRGMKLVRDGLEMTRELFGAEDAVTATRMAELALLHDLRGDYVRAAEIGRQAYDVHARARGETHPETLTILNNLAGFHREAGNLERPLTLYRRLHALREQVLPADHLLLAFTAHGLGNTLRKLGRFDESERWLREALRLCLLHESHNEGITRENLARTLAAAGRRAQALEQQRLAVRAYEEFYGGEAEATRDARRRLETLALETG